MNGSIPNETLRTHVPYNSLDLSDKNVRQVSPSYIESLAASIKSNGVLNNLIVIEKKKKSKVRYEIVAGKRRFLALQLLCSNNDIPSDYPIPVLVKTPCTATVVSLVENFHREPMHPIDEYKAFKKLSDEGLSVSEIALQLGLSDLRVRQRLALGSASAELLEEALKGNMTLEQLKIMCQVDTHEEQNRIWFGITNSYDRSPFNLRKFVTHETFKLNHKLVMFVGLDNYEQNGGGVHYDLFEPDKESVVTDPDLLIDMANQKLKDIADESGWAWSKISLDRDYDELAVFHTVDLQAYERPMTDTEKKQWEEWEDKMQCLEEALTEACENEDDEEADRLNRESESLENSMEELRKTLIDYDSVKASSGVYLYVDAQGCVSKVEGLVEKSSSQSEINDNSGKSSNESPKGMSGSLKEYLACARSSIMHNEIINNPKVGKVLVCHALVLSIFYKPWSSVKFLDLNLTSHTVFLEKHELNDMPSTSSIAERHEYWASQMPDEHELFTFLNGLDDAGLDELMSFCAGYGLRFYSPSEDVDSLYAILGQHLGTDIKQYWQPTATNFFNRLNKQLITESLCDAGIQIDSLNTSMKKCEMASKAEVLIKQNPDWQPLVLRF